MTDYSPLSNILIPVIIVVGIFGIIAEVIKPSSKKKKKKRNNRTTEALKNWNPPKGEPTYKQIKTLFTAAELSFYNALKTAIGNDFHISGKVRLADVITPQKTQDQSAWQTAFNQIVCKHLDFVLCDPSTLAIVAAIELDDKSHQRKDRIKRDQFLNQVMESAGVPLIRFQARPSYDADQIKEKLEPLKQKNAA